MLTVEERRRTVQREVVVEVPRVVEPLVMNTVTESVSNGSD